MKLSFIQNLCVACAVFYSAEAFHLAAATATSEIRNSPRLRFLLENPQHRPLRSQLLTLRPEDTRLLIRGFHEIDQISKRRSLVWALAYSKDDEVARLFTNFLTKELRGKRISADDQQVLAEMAFGLGVLAQDSDLAFSFIKGATDGQFWRRTRQWSSPLGPDSDGYMASYSIQAVGASGRPEVPVILERLKAVPKYRIPDHPNYVRSLSGDISYAAFLHWVIATYGKDEFHAKLHTRSMENLRAEWKASDEGRAWTAWDKRVVFGDQPEQ